MNPILDAIGGVGYALDTPGAYFRGLLAGSPGQRYSGRDLLSTYGLTDESDPWGGVKGFGAEMVLDPLALAGPITGAYKGARGINALTSAARNYGDDVLRTVARTPGTDEAYRIATRKQGGDLYAELFGAGPDPLGHVKMAGAPGASETSTVAWHPIFGKVVPPGSPVTRINEIGLADHIPFQPADWQGLQGRGFGQQMVVDALNASPSEWHFNSQASDTAAPMLQRLADKGLAELTWDMRRSVPDVGGPFVMRLTPEGRAMAGTMGLVHGATTTESTGSPILRALARFTGDESGALKIPGAQELAERVGSDPWFLKSYAPDLTTAKLDPLKTPLALDLQELGNVRGVGLHADPDALMDLKGQATRPEHIRDLTYANHPKHGAPTGYDPEMSSDQLAKLWTDTFPESGLNPSLYEAGISPKGVLDLSQPMPSGLLRELVHDYGTRLWSARQRAAQAQGMDWSMHYHNLGELPEQEMEYLVEAGQDMTGAGSKIANWLDPYGDAATLEQHPIGYRVGNYMDWIMPFRRNNPDPHIDSVHIQRLMSKIGEMNHDFNRMMQEFPPDLLRQLRGTDPEQWSKAWSLKDQSLQHLQELGAHKDLLHQYLAQYGIDALMGPGGQLNLLDPRAITSFDRVG